MEPYILRGRVGLSSLKALPNGQVAVFAEIKLGDRGTQPILAPVGSPSAALLLKGGDICLLMEKIDGRLQSVGVAIEEPVY